MCVCAVSSQFIRKSGNNSLPNAECELGATVPFECKLAKTSSWRGPVPFRASFTVQMREMQPAGLRNRQRRVKP